MNYPLSKIAEIFSSQGFTITKYSSDLQVDWNDLLSKAAFQPNLYSRATLDYYFEYFSIEHSKYQDISLVILHQNKPVAIWPIFVGQNENGVEARLFSCPEGLLPPLIVGDQMDSTVKKIHRTCLKVAISIAEEFCIGNLEIASTFMNTKSLSEWDRQCSSTAIEISSKFNWYLNLEQSSPEQMFNIRRSYRNLIKQEIKMWTFQVMDSDNFSEEEWSSFQLLHKEVSGRSTRSNQTWKIQKECLQSGGMILVTSRLGTGPLNGGALFSFTKDESTYAVGAYTRDNLLTPVSHAIQYIGIDVMQKRGVKWHNLGVAAIDQNIERYGEKDLSISKFKEGFASELVLRLNYNIVINGG